MGIIDCLAAGFRLIARRPWLLLIPVLLDLFLWMGPHIGLAQIAQQVQETLAAQQAGAPAADYSTAITQQTQQVIEQIGKDANLLSLMGAGVPGIPSLVAVSPPQVNPLPTAPTVVQAQSAGQVTLWGLGFLLIGSILSSLYVTWIGRTVRGDLGTPDEAPFAGHALHTWTRVLLMILVLIALLLVVSIPIVLVAFFALMVSQSLAVILLNLMAIVVLWAAIWVVIYMYFVVDAVVLNHAGLLRAMWNSVNVVTRNLWPSVGLVLLVWIVGNGLMLIWTRLEFAAWATAVGVLANAFVGTSLTAATLFFYAGRYRLWQEHPETASPSPFLRIWRGPKT